MVARGRLGCFRFAALARLRFAPPEIFAQRRLQPMAPQILVVALFISLAPLIRHLKNPPGIFCQVHSAKYLAILSSRRPRLDQISLAAAEKAEPGWTSIDPACSRACASGGLVARTAASSGFFRPIFFLRPCCRSSVVEHSLGKGEVDSSILSGSTIFECIIRYLCQ